MVSRGLQAGSIPLVIAAYVVEVVGLALIVLFAHPSAFMIVGIVLVGFAAFFIIAWSPRKQRDMVIFSIILVSGAIWRMSMEWRRYDLLQAHPVMTRGIVVDTGSYTAKVKGGARWVRYTYTVDGNLYDGEEFNAGYAPGDTIVIHYAAEDPATSLPLPPGMVR